MHTELVDAGERGIEELPSRVERYGVTRTNALRIVRPHGFLRVLVPALPHSTGKQLDDEHKECHSENRMLR